MGARCVRVVPPGDLAADGVIYAEVRFAPELHLERGLALDEVVEAVQDGFAQGQAGAALRSLRGRFDRREQCGAARLGVARVDDLDGQHPVLKALACVPAR